MGTVGVISLKRRISSTPITQPLGAWSAQATAMRWVILSIRFLASGSALKYNFTRWALISSWCSLTLLLGLKLRHPLPVVGGIDLNRQPQREPVEAL